MKTINQLIATITDTKTRGAWNTGVKQYALDILERAAERAEYEQHEPATVAELKEYSLNGAKDWKQYSEGGCALIYDGAIATRLCTSSEFQKTYLKGKEPNSRETWVECQSRALRQAWMLIARIAEEA